MIFQALASGFCYADLSVNPIASYLFTCDSSVYSFEYEYFESNGLCSGIPTESDTYESECTFYQSGVGQTANNYMAAYSEQSREMSSQDNKKLTDYSYYGDSEGSDSEYYYTYYYDDDGDDGYYYDDDGNALGNDDYYAYYYDDSNSNGDSSSYYYDPYENQDETSFDTPRSSQAMKSSLRSGDIQSRMNRDNEKTKKRSLRSKKIIKDMFHRSRHSGKLCHTL